MRMFKQVIHTRLAMPILAMLNLVAMASDANAQAMRDYTALPALSTKIDSARSIMLTMSSDHQLFIKAYNDFSDLTGDGNPENTYTSGYNYVGYFDSTLCYTHDDAKFNPAARWNSGTRRCAAGQWSGNFLNWATMTRIDLVRQVLYGGLRSTDTATATVLERSYLPQDAHSFAKYVPFNDLEGLAVVPTSGSQCAAGSETSNASCRGFTFCNTTLPPTTGVFSQDVDQPPVLRVVKGNYQLWDASERYQCLTTSALYPTRGDPNYDTVYNTVRDNSEAKPAFDGLPGTEAIRFDPAGANLNNSANSGIAAFARAPVKADVTDYIVRVSVCVANLIDDAETDGYECEKYGENYKPVGLLQRYGAHPEKYDVRFGLLTGSYNNNKEFGALRKNLADFSEEINANGTFKSTTQLTNSIVHNLNALRILDYRYLDVSGNYRGTYQSQDGRADEGRTGAQVACSWGQNTFQNGSCRNWGNPFSKLLIESYRYLTGATTPRVAVVNEAGIRPGLSIAAWSLPSDGTPQQLNEFSCSSKSVLGVNASAVSYDWSAQLAALTPSGLGIPGTGTASLAELTNSLGISGNFFIGHNGGTVNNTNEIGQCSAKEVTSLGQVRGTCPETPRLDGGYLGAGLAKYIFDTHKINTYGVSLTDAVPRINIPLDPDNLVNGPKVVIVPACHNRTIAGGQGGNCALVNFKVIQDSAGTGDVLRSGSYFVSWEDTEQGGDYDVDASGLIRYELRAGQVIVETKLLYNGTPDVLEFGYVISGTGDQKDGMIFPARTLGGNDNVSVLPADTTNTDDCTGGNNCVKVDGGASQKVTYNVSQAGSSVAFLPSPLQLAATHGSELGEAGHVPVSNPGDLKSQLDTVLGIAASQPTPGTGASVATAALTGEGVVLSSLYAPEYVHEDEKVTWIGQLNGLFYKDNYFWEDCNRVEGAVAGVITDDDCVVRIYTDEESKETVFNRYSVIRDLHDRITGTELISAGLPYIELKPLWSVAEQLSEVSAPTAQRAYTTVDKTKRHIFTAVAADNKPYVTSADAIPFVTDSFATTTGATVGLGGRNYRLLDAGDTAAAQEVVRYIRGDETITDARSRTLDGKRWLLGDIMHSTAALVARPSGLYDIGRIGDETYAAFAQRYRNRRLVTYVGGNDGMLHAFNGGFYNYNPGAPGYLLKPVDSNLKEHALGAELWAYVPYNLLPHLKWLKDPKYSHVYYVDAKVHTFDVNIFTGAEYSEADYPGDWGTILVVGMRFGGGDYPLDSDGNNSKDRTLRSAYVIMDVTNPEKPPRLLAEITDEDLGFTTGDLDVVSFRKRNTTTGSYQNPSLNKWYLVFGSGPTGATALQDATSDQPAQLFSLNLNLLTDPTKINDWVDQLPTEVGKAYVGGVTAVDWNSDFNTDMLYVGVVGTGTGAADLKGALLQAPVSLDGDELDINPEPLLSDANQPFSRAPMVVRDQGANSSYWVYAATGKLLVSDHLRPNNIGVNWIYGVRVNDQTETPAHPWLTNTELTVSKLKDVTDVTVSTAVESGARTFTVEDEDLEDVTTPQAMENYIRETSDVYGWRRELVNRPELVFTAPAFAGTTFTVGSFSPTILDCKPTGVSRQYWLNLFTGLPQTDTRNVFIQNSDGVTAADKESLTEGDLSAHMGAQEGVLLGGAKAGDDIITVRGTGELDSEDASGPQPSPTRRAWREIPSDEIN